MITTKDDYLRRVKGAAVKLSRHGQLLSLHKQIEPTARPNYCFDNVEAKIARDGGTAQYGWLFVDLFPFSATEAHVHCVWRSPVGELLDITPSPPAETLAICEAKGYIVHGAVFDSDGGEVFITDESLTRLCPKRCLSLSKNKTQIAECRKGNRQEWRQRNNPEYDRRNIPSRIAGATR